MDREKLHRFFWPIAYFIDRILVRLKFKIKYEICSVEEPCIVISNHVTNWDPLLLTLSFPKKQLGFVANEHIFRNKFTSKLINFFFELIARRKGSSGADTVMACLRRLRSGGSICLFAEGETTWDGISIAVPSATGKMVRTSGVTLVTYRIEGGYLSLPRWAKTSRRGMLRGHPVGVYSPEQLKAMKPNEITELINRDIYENAWERQRREHNKYKGRNLAEGMERAVFLCPQCRRIDTMTGAGDHISCKCGFSLRFTDEGSFDPPVPFETIRQWNLWQDDSMARGDFVHTDELFSDGGVVLKRILQGHEEEELYEGRAVQLEDRLVVGDRSFPLTDISNMAMFKTHALLFSVGEEYFELKANKTAAMRKYLLYWQTRHSRSQG